MRDNRARVGEDPHFGDRVDCKNSTAALDKFLPQTSPACGSGHESTFERCNTRPILGAVSNNILRKSGVADISPSARIECDFD